MKIVKEISLAGISLIALATPSYAQTPEVAENESAEDDSDVIIVTARRRDESIQDVPSVVNAVTAESISELNLRKFEDIAALVPGFNVAAGRNSAGVQTTLRGVNFNSGTSGTNATVQYYLNDGAVPSGAITFALYDIQQIEVLRGPQGTLRGRSTPSGSINITTRRPDLFEVGVTADATVTDIGGYQVGGAFNIPVIADKLGIRIAGVKSKDEADRVKAQANSLDPYNETESIRASVRADPFDGVLLLDFTYQNAVRKSLVYQQVESGTLVTGGGTASPITISAKQRLGVAGDPNTARAEYSIFNWQAQLNLAGQKLTYLGLVTKGQFLSGQPQDEAGVFINDTAPRFTPSALNPIGRDLNDIRANTLINSTPQKNTVHEVRLQNEERVAGIFDYVVGAMSFDTVSTPNTVQTTAISLVPTQTISTAVPIHAINITNINIASTSKESSVFGNVTAHIGEKIEVSGGLRKIWYESLTIGTINGVVSPGLSTVQPTTGTGTIGHTVYSGSVQYKMTDDVMAYANVGTSWRPPAFVFGGPALPSPLQRQFTNTDPETSISYEIGFKSNLFDNRLLFNVSAFYQKFKNYPYRSPARIQAFDAARNSLNGFNYASGLPVTVKGVETDFGFKVSDNFNIGGTVAFSEGKVKSGAIPCLDINRDGIQDTTPATSSAVLIAAYGGEFIASCTLANPIAANVAPRWSGALTSEYGAALSTNVDGYLRGLLSWAGKTKNDPVNNFDSVKAFGLLNLFLGVRDPDGAWDVSLYGKNVTNTFRVLSRTNGPLLSPVGANANFSSNYYGITTTPPREFGINVRFAIGSR